MSVAWRRRFKLLGAGLLMIASLLFKVLYFAVLVLLAFSSGKRGSSSSSSSSSDGDGG
ncbi:hypothetical protein ACFW9L_38350 [Streptomyces sp. NPDC059517]|uniref:hypothetical protein n=1 Tax=Streptomyces sp. NPDC059517 TaxID=3346855 RepID=UPI0036846AC0